MPRYERPWWKGRELLRHRTRCSLAKATKHLFQLGKDGRRRHERQLPGSLVATRGSLQKDSKFRSEGVFGCGGVLVLSTLFPSSFSSSDTQQHAQRWYKSYLTVLRVCVPGTPRPTSRGSEHNFCLCCCAGFSVVRRDCERSREKRRHDTYRKQNMCHA